MVSTFVRQELESKAWEGWLQRKRKLGPWPADIEELLRQAYFAGYMETQEALQQQVTITVNEAIDLGLHKP